MTDNSSLLGPVELMMVSTPDTGISPQVLAALAAQVEAGTVRILDLVLVTRAGEDEIEATELSLDQVGIEIMDLALPGPPVTRTSRCWRSRSRSARAPPSSHSNWYGRGTWARRWPRKAAK